jgi:Immunity protein Imm1
MPPDILFNGRSAEISSVEELGEALERFNAVSQFELWASVADGPSMCMLRNGANAWLMYLRHSGDSGFTSVGETSRIGEATYLLCNGQEDKYPLVWCIEIEQCYKAVAYFYVNDGARPLWINWRES